MPVQIVTEVGTPKKEIDIRAEFPSRIEQLLFRVNFLREPCVTFSGLELGIRSIEAKKQCP
jgi:hypothetical protein